jgi:antitoxin (DNA-binding transcriptional repressor) of toxin-antitoxin stability system
MTTHYPEVPSAKANQAPATIFDRVFKGETVLLTRYGRPYVLLCPPPEANDAPEPQTKTG